MFFLKPLCPVSQAYADESKFYRITAYWNLWKITDLNKPTAKRFSFFFLVNSYLCRICNPFAEPSSLFSWKGLGDHDRMWKGIARNCNIAKSHGPQFISFNSFKQGNRMSNNVSSYLFYIKFNILFEFCMNVVSYGLPYVVTIWARQRDQPGATLAVFVILIMSNLSNQK